MSKITASVVAGLAIEMDSARREVKRLRIARAAFKCEREDDRSGRQRSDRDPAGWPCWKPIYVEDGQDSYWETADNLRDEVECDQCEARRPVHAAYLKARLAVSALAPKLARACRGYQVKSGKSPSPPAGGAVG